MLYKLRSFLSFLWKSSNQHGVHSPFVYNFITKGLYNKSDKTILEFDSPLKNLNNKEKKIVSKIFKYFGNHTVYTDVKEVALKPKSIFYFSSSENITLSNLKNNDSFLIIRGIHQNKVAFLNWGKLVKKGSVTVSIDLYYFGLIFFRKEQAKEHFTIRT